MTFMQCLKFHAAWFVVYFLAVGFACLIGAEDNFIFGLLLLVPITIMVARDLYKHRPRRHIN